MNIQGVRPNPGYLVTQENESTVKTKSGVISTENTDDFLVYGKVVKSDSQRYPEGCMVIYHILDTESFRDGTLTFSIVHQDKIKGLYELQEV